MRDNKITRKIADITSKTFQELERQGFKFQKIDTLTQLVRIGICENCPHFDEKDNRRCKKCLCPMDYKTSLLYEPINPDFMTKKVKITCPIGKW